MKRVTKHGRKRLKQRNVNQCRNGISNNARKYGKTKRYFEGEFYEYLLNRTSRGCSVKVYKNDIYIFGKTSKNLITTYPIPERFLPIEQYLIESDKRHIIENVSRYSNKDVVITLKNNIEIKGIIIDKVYNELMQLYETIVKTNNYIINLSIDYIENIELDYDEFNNGLLQEMEISA